MDLGGSRVYNIVVISDTGDTPVLFIVLYSPSTRIVARQWGTDAWLTAQGWTR